MGSSLWRVAIVTVVVGWIAASRAEDRGDGGSGGLRAGAAIVDITPPVGGDIIGGFLPIPSTQVHDPLHARCLVLDDGTTRLALVVCDLLGIHRCVSDRARDLVAERCGIPGEQVLISATHTHSATSALGPRSLAFAPPDDPAAERTPYQEFVAGRIAAGVAAAVAALEPAELGHGAIDVPQHLSNRRWFKKPGTIPANPFGAVDMVQMNPGAGSPDLLEPAGPVDPRLSFLAVRSRTGRPLAVYAAYGLHYVGGVPAGDISADYFAVFCDELGRLVAATEPGRPFVALLANAASGDVNNIDFTGTRPPREPYEQMRLVAHDLARRVADALPDVTYETVVPLAARMQELDVPARVPTADELAWARTTLEGPEPRPGSVDLPRAYASRLLAMADNPPIEPVPLQLLRIGRVAIGTMPCEVFAEIGLEFKGRAALQPAIFVSLAHGYVGYLPSARQHRLGGYETWLGTNRLGPAASGAMVDALVAMSREVAGETSPPQVPSPAAIQAAAILPGDMAFDLVAAEPAVIDPVAVTFDETGRPYVAEYRDYPLGPPEGSPSLSRIVRLDDADGDGCYESSTVFADGIPFMQGVLAVRGGLLVTASPDVVFLADDDGDGRADRREVVATGFRVGNPQLRAACPQLDIDNSVSITGGLSGGRVGKPGRPPEEGIAIDRRDVRIDLAHGTIAAATGFGQFGNTFDDVGHRYTASNRNPLMTIRLPLEALVRNGLVDLGDGFEDAAPSGAASRVFPILGTNATAASHTGTHTSACGVSIFRGDLLGPDAAGDAFVCEPVSHLVVRRRPRPAGASFRSERVEPEGVDFLAGRSSFFRPVFTATAPDGSLWVVDMCRGSVEHPEYMVPGMAATIDLRAGDTAGRIWRVAKRGLEPRPWAAPTTAAEAVAMLADPNGWRRTTAQRLIVEGRFPQAAETLTRFLEADGGDVATVHALWSLAGLDRLDEPQVRRAAASPHASVREAAARLAVVRDDGTGRLATAVGMRLASDPDAHVRLAAALALAAAREPEATAGLVELMARTDIDPWIARAVLSGAVGRATAIATGVAAGPGASTAAVGDPAHCGEWVAFVERLGVTAAGPPAESAGDDTHEACRLVAARVATGNAGWFDVVFVGGLASRRPLERLAEAGLDAAARGGLVAVAETIATDQGLPDPVRRGAVRLLAATAGTPEAEAARRTLTALVGTHESAAVQGEAAAAVARGGDPAAVVAVLGGLEPAVRAAATAALLDRVEGVVALLDAIAAGHVPAACVPFERRKGLLDSAAAGVRERAAAIWSADPPTSLSTEEFTAVVAEAKQGGDTARGRTLFVKHCGNCHAVDGAGHAVGPDLAEAGDRPIDTIVQSIVDPNRAVEPRWEATVVVTHDGTALEGILASSSSDTVVLTRAGGDRTIVPRAEIETLRAAGRSLMPEGFGRQLTAAEFADLVAFLRSGRPVPATP